MPWLAQLHLLHDVRVRRLLNPPQGGRRPSAFTTQWSELCPVFQTLMTSSSPRAPALPCALSCMLRACAVAARLRTEKLKLSTSVLCVQQADVLFLSDMAAYMHNEGDAKDLPHAPLNHLLWWSWNPNSGDTGGLVQDDWATVRCEYLLPMYLHQYIHNCGAMADFRPGRLDHGAPLRQIWLSLHGAAQHLTLPFECTNLHG